MAKRRLRRVSIRPLSTKATFGAVRSVRLGRSSHIGALSADSAQDKWQIAPQTFDLG